jgi:hypothetical protein
MATSIATEPMAKKARTDPDDPTPDDTTPKASGWAPGPIDNEVVTVRLDVCETLTTVTTTTERNKVGRILKNNKETKTTESYKTVISPKEQP